MPCRIIVRASHRDAPLKLMQPIIRSQPLAYHQVINKSIIIDFYKKLPTLTNKIYYGSF